MANYWIRDAQARVLGPLDLTILKSLIISGRIRGIVDVSPDGQVWEPVARHPEIGDLQSRQTSEARRAEDLAEAERLGRELQVLKGRPPHLVFGIAPDAPIDLYRAAFFRLIKRFYPDSLPPEAAPELQQASQRVFEYLSRLMSFIEKQPAPAAKPTRPPPVLGQAGAREVGAFNSRELERPQRPVPAPTARPVAAPIGPEPSREPDPAPVVVEHLAGNLARARVTVTSGNRGMFTDNRLLNLAQGGAFIPCDEPLALGCRVELMFQLGATGLEVRASGTVVWWSAGDARQARGFGVKLTGLAPEDRAVIENYLATPGG